MKLDWQGYEQTAFCDPYLITVAADGWHVTIEREDEEPYKVAGEDIALPIDEAKRRAVSAALEHARQAVSNLEAALADVICEAAP